MGIVHQLSQHVANCIAAGEVVENPASVVKELCENSIDAGATEIAVSMRSGGIAELIVSDNGRGMSAEDAELCFARHATSKLSSEEDLGSIGTLGFRGEALAAISAVSRVTLETCEPGAECGTRVVREFGETLETGIAVRAPGTTFEIRDLFRNTPARMKFLRSDAAEGAAVASAVGRLALSHPEIRFTMTRETKLAFETSGSGDLYQAICDFCGREFARGLLRIDAADSPDVSVPRVWGYVTAPQAARATRAMQYVYLNGRLIQSKAVTAALDDACHGFITTGRFPGCVLHIALDPALCDINVHPGKLTVKFTRESEVYTAVRHAVRGVLEAERDRPAFTMTGTKPQAVPETIPDAEPGDTRQPAPPTAPGERRTETPAQPAGAFRQPPKTGPVFTGAPLSEARQTAMSLTVSAASVRLNPSVSEAPAPVPQPDEAAEPRPALREREPDMPPPHDDAEAPPETAAAAAAADFRVLGILFDTYLVVEHGDEAVFIDFHATHERIRFDRLVREYESGGIVSQTLLASVILPVEPEEYASILANVKQLSHCGVEAEAFGDREIAVRALPAGTDPEQTGALLAALTHELSQPGTASPQEALLHLIACHGAKRAGDSLTEAERRALAARVLADPALRTCPHGRPVALVMHKRDFIRNFGR